MLCGVLKDVSSLLCSLVAEGSFPGGPIEQLEFFPKFQEGSDFTLCLTRIPQDCQVHPGVMSAAPLQTLDLSHQGSVMVAVS